MKVPWELCHLWITSSPGDIDVDSYGVEKLTGLMTLQLNVLQRHGTSLLNVSMVSLNHTQEVSSCHVSQVNCTAHVLLCC